MRLFVNPANGRITDADGNSIPHDTLHQLGDNLHSYIFYRVDNSDPPTKLIAAIKRGKRIIQSATIYLAGRNPYAIDLSPDASPFPLESIVKELLRLGISQWGIVPMFTGGTMGTKPIPGTISLRASDGAVVNRVTVPASNSRPDAVTYGVKNAKWVIMHSETDGVLFVFIWPEAQQQKEHLLNAARELDNVRAA